MATLVRAWNGPVTRGFSRGDAEEGSAARHSSSPPPREKGNRTCPRPSAIHRGRNVSPTSHSSGSLELFSFLPTAVPREKFAPVKTQVRHPFALRALTSSSHLGLLALGATLAVGANATTITFDFNPRPANNTDLSPTTFGSFAAADGNGYTTSDGTGATPNIGLTWAPTGGTVAMGPDINILEIHSSTTFGGAGFTVPVLQFDMDLSDHTVLPADPTIDFTVTGGWSLQLNSLQIGNATDQSEAAYRWNISLIRLSDSVVVDTKTTAYLSAGNLETVVFNYTGAPNESYRLLFDDEGANRVRSAIDNLSFSQVPEPSTLALFALGGLGFLARRMTRKS